MLVTVRTTVLPEFSVEVYPTEDDTLTAHQRYVLVLTDGTLGTLELVFPSAEDLRAFLTWTRDALAAAKQEAHARKLRFRPDPIAAGQTTLF